MNTVNSAGELKLLVPTYNGRAYASQVEKGALREYGTPYVPIVIREAAGIRIVLGSHDPDDKDAPDILVERRPKGWAIFLHPWGRADASGYVYFLDDGRSFLVKEFGRGAIELAEVHEELREVDGLK
ncbi:MAG TPA: hypothetical protein VG713_20320 [Pirellulales bacterium]|nr:hypothetical protein [Pirellulales bacterium]